MKGLALCLAVSLALVSAGPAQTTPAELKKAKIAYVKADAFLNAAYKAALAALPPDRQAKLRTEQREWIEHRDYMAGDQPRQAGDDPEKPEASAAYWEAMAGLSDSRTAWLQSFTVKGLPPGLTGEWMDAQGGVLSLQERKDGVAFSIEVVRGPTHHTGELSGLAAKTKDGAKFREKVPAEEKREPCVLELKLTEPGALEIKGENTGHYHGARAYFDGTYRKVAKLRKPVEL